MLKKYQSYQTEHVIASVTKKKCTKKGMSDKAKTRKTHEMTKNCEWHEHERKK